jgi:uncharacterized protein YbaP (TraB family)
MHDVDSSVKPTRAGAQTLSKLSQSQNCTPDHTKLLDERNLRMRDASLPLLQRGAAFIAVGAAHLPGENGLLRLFELEGYRVERLE